MAPLSLTSRVAAVAVAVALGAGVVTACSSSGSGGSAAAPATTAPVDPRSVPAAPSAGCGTTPVVPAGEAKVDLTSSGDARFYQRHVPPAHDGTTPVPVVVDLHGWSENAVTQEKMSGYGPYGDTHGFVTVTPEAQGPVHVWDLSLDGKDLRYVGDVLDDVERTLCVDENRVFVSGLSYGAFLTTAVSCRFADRVAAAAPVAGIADIPGCQPSRAVPVLAFHGTADPYVPYDGSVGPAALNLPAPDGSGKTLAQSGLVDLTKKGPSILDNTTAWASRNGCGTTPTETAAAPDVTTITFPCPAGAEVVLERITDGGHAWPGSAFSAALASVVGRTTTSIDATALAWTFFQNHPKS